jgi:hypothetical protein
MHSILRPVSAACAALLMASGAVRAQRPARVEFGVDAALNHVSYDLDPGSASNTFFDFPAQAIRIGFEMTPLIWLEPTLGIHSVSGDGGLSMIDFDIGVPISLSGPVVPTAQQFFVRPLIGFRHESLTGEHSDTQTALGGGVGMRVHVSGRLTARFEGRYVHGLREGDFIKSTNEIGLFAGVSFFTR